MGTCITKFNYCQKDLDKKFEFNCEKEMKVYNRIYKFITNNGSECNLFDSVNFKSELIQTFYNQKTFKSNNKIENEKQFLRILEIRENNIIKNILKIQRKFRAYNIMKKKYFFDYKVKSNIFSEKIESESIKINNYDEHEKNKEYLFNIKNSSNLNQINIKNEKNQEISNQEKNDNNMFENNFNNFNTKFISDIENSNNKYKFNFDYEKNYQPNTFISENSPQENTDKLDIFKDSKSFIYLNKQHHTSENKNLGKIFFDECNFYIGDIVNEKANGFGIFYNGNKDNFKGTWVNNKANGLGYYKSKDFTILGRWINDKQNGFGITVVKKNKLYYEGDLENGKKEGLGIIHINDGKYEGEFKNDKIEGFGTFTFKDERIYSGEWKDNKIEGFGILKWKDGKKYEGTFKDNKKNGFGIFFSENKIYFGNWESSKLEGKAAVYEAGTFNEYYFQNGKKVKNVKIVDPKYYEFLKKLVK